MLHENYNYINCKTSESSMHVHFDELQNVHYNR